MPKFLIATYPSPGHVYSAAAVVAELSGRGHEVHWYIGRR
jgi:UDP:flavonoid glycosyltransferase YjiC (YdhE family)